MAATVFFSPGILDMDRQYNAVNFQYFAQAAEAGVTKAGAEASFKRRLCTSRLSFYIEARAGGRRGGKVVQKTWQGLGKTWMMGHAEWGFHGI